MALYLGSNGHKINLDGKIYRANWYSAILTIEDILLSSSDDCLFKDFNGLYLAVKEKK